MSAAATIKRLSLRIILTSDRVRDVVVAAVAGVVLGCAFPKIGAAWTAPLGAAALFWLWQNASWKRAFALGWFAGTIFFSITFAWFGYTVGNYLPPILTPGVVVVPAAIEALAIGATGALSALAFTRAPRAIAPLCGAAAFAVLEWARSVGTLGLPFSQLGTSQASTPLAIFAAYIGTFGVTFVVCAIGAYLADSVARKTIRPFLVACACIAVGWVLAWFAWPARHAPPPSMRVTVVQGNIAQSLKWSAQSVALAIDRYSAMTARARSEDPALVVWPETAIAEQLNFDIPTEARFGRLAKQLHATLAVGAQYCAGANFCYRSGKLYNSLYIFGPDGRLQPIYNKRQMVPIVEEMPWFFRWVPFVTELGGGAMSHGNVDAVYRTPSLSFAPLICWESAFADVAHAQIRNGAQILVVTTDDAWFGETAGPYMHAQIAQLRAIENGTWVVRAAATGVSGIVAPDGAWTKQVPLDTQEAVTGSVGAPAPTLFARIGPTPIALLFALIYVAGLFARRRLQ